MTEAREHNQSSSTYHEGNFPINVDFTSMEIQREALRAKRYYKG